MKPASPGGPVSARWVKRQVVVGCWSSSRTNRTMATAAVPVAGHGDLTRHIGGPHHVLEDLGRSARRRSRVVQPRRVSRRRHRRGPSPRAVRAPFERRVVRVCEELRVGRVTGADVEHARGLWHGSCRVDHEVQDRFAFPWHLCREARQRLGHWGPFTPRTAQASHEDATARPASRRPIGVSRRRAPPRALYDAPMPVLRAAQRLTRGWTDARRFVFACLAITTASILLYLQPVFDLGFYYDDYPMLAALDDAPGHSWWDLYKSCRAVETAGRPGTCLYHSGVNLLLGNDPAGYHVLSIVFLALGTILLYAVLRRCGMGFWPALLACLLFVVYPGSNSTRLWPTGVGPGTSWPCTSAPCCSRSRHCDGRGASARAASRFLALFALLVFTYEAVIVLSP